MLTAHRQYAGDQVAVAQQGATDEAIDLGVAWGAVHDIGLRPGEGKAVASSAHS